jgi:hypothetical protein
MNIKEERLASRPFNKNILLVTFSVKTCLTQAQTIAACIANMLCFSEHFVTDE